MKKKLRVAYLLPILLILLIAVPVLAVSYSADIEIFNTGASSNMVGLVATANITYMIAEGFISATGTDTDVEYGGVAIPYMLRDTAILFATSLGSHKVVTFNMGVPDIGTFDIITLNGGYVTVADNATLELGNHFQFLITDVYIDTVFGLGKNIIYKNDACRLFVSETVTGDITFEVTDNTTAIISMTAGAIPPDEYALIEVSANTTHMMLYINSVLRAGPVALTNDVDDTIDDWVLFSGNTTIYVGSFILNK